MQQPNEPVISAPHGIFVVGKTPVAIASKPNARQLFVANQDSPFLTYIDLVTQRALPIEVRARGCNALLYHAATDAVIAATVAGSLIYLDTERGRVLDEIVVHDSYFRMHPRENGEELIIVRGTRLSIFNIGLRKMRQDLDLKAEIGLVVELDRRTALVELRGSSARDSSTLVVMDLDAGSCLATLPIPSLAPGQLVSSQARGRLYLTNSRTGQLHVLDTSLRLLASLAIGDLPTTLAFARVDSRLCVACRREVVVLDTDNLDVLGRIARRQGGAGLVYDPSSDVVYTLNQATISIEAIAMESYQRVAIMESHVARTGDVIDGSTLFDAQNRILAIASAGSTNSREEFFHDGVLAVFDAL